MDPHSPVLFIFFLPPDLPKSTWFLAFCHKKPNRHIKKKEMRLKERKNKIKINLNRTKKKDKKTISQIKAHEIDIDEEMHALEHIEVP